MVIRMQQLSGFDSSRLTCKSCKGPILIQFSNLITAEVLEISADNEDEYNVYFLNNSTLLGNLTVPELKDYVTLIRYLRLPESVYDKQFDKVLVQPTQEGTHCLGNVFFYNDSYQSHKIPQNKNASQASEKRQSIVIRDYSGRNRYVYLITSEGIRRLPDLIERGNRYAIEKHNTVSYNYTG